MRKRDLALLLALAGSACAPGVSSIRRDSAESRALNLYESAIETINQEHARNPGRATEKDLAGRLPADARAAFDALLELDPNHSVKCAVVSAAMAALELDLKADYDRARTRLGSSPDGLGSLLGPVVSRPKYLLLGSGLSPDYLEKFAQVTDAVLDAYDALFGFEEWSKIPGKKLRIRVSLVPEIVRPPHFNPFPRFHSEIVYFVVDPDRFVSPTDDGKFLLYGLAHELGHAIAMWGSEGRYQDHHAWAHFTGDAVVDYLSGRTDLSFMKEVEDVEWRSLARERKRLASRTPSLEDHDGVLRLLIDIHDRLGPRAIGAAINRMDRAGKCRRFERVRYYRFSDFRDFLLGTTKDASLKQFIQALIPR